MIRCPSPNFGPRDPGTTIDMLVLHYTGMPSAAAALERLCDPAAEVSAHYFVEEDGRVLALVAEEMRAWHAGVSEWRGQVGINNRSIGVEIVNPGHEFGYRPFPERQMRAVADLCQGILERNPIPQRNVVGHSDIASWRKCDPGELFDWPFLAHCGIGLFPSDEAIAKASKQGDVPALLRRIGYKTEGSEATADAAYIAFQRRFNPHALIAPDEQETLRRLHAVATMMDTSEKPSPQ